MGSPSAWPQVLDFFGTPLVIEASPGQLSSDAGLHSCSLPPAPERCAAQESNRLPWPSRSGQPARMPTTRARALSERLCSVRPVARGPSTASA